MTYKAVKFIVFFAITFLRMEDGYNLNNLYNGRKSYFICSKNLPSQKHFTITTGRLEKLSGLEEDVYRLSLIFYKLDNNKFTITSEMIGFSDSTLEEKGLSYTLTPFNFKTLKDILEEAFGGRSTTTKETQNKSNNVIEKGDSRNFVFEISFNKNKILTKKLVKNSEPGIEYTENCSVFETPEGFIESIDNITKSVDVTILVSLMQINWHILEVINSVLATKKHLLLGEKIDFVKSDKNVIEAKKEKSNNLHNYSGIDNKNKKTFDKVIRELKRLKYTHFRNRLLISITVCLIISSVILVRVYNLKKEFGKINI